MARSYFINAEKVSTYGYIDGNVEQDVIKNTIFRVQESQLQPILGTPLFNKLKEKIQEWDGGVGTGDYYDLLKDYITPCLIPMVEFKITFHLRTKITSKTVGANNDEYIRANSVSDNNNLRDELRKDITHFKNQLIKHLCDDKGVKYPEYLERTGLAEDFTPEESGPDYLSQFDVI
jgi:hypothetical protein